MMSLRKTEHDRHVWSFIAKLFISHPFFHLWLSTHFHSSMFYQFHPPDVRPLMCLEPFLHNALMLSFSLDCRALGNRSCHLSFFAYNELSDCWKYWIMVLVGGMKVQWSAHLTSGFGLDLSCSLWSCAVCMFSPRRCGFAPAARASSHVLKSCSFVSPVMNWPPVLGVSCVSPGASWDQLQPSAATL